MTVHDVGRLGGTHHGQVASECVEETRMPWILGGHGRRRGDSAYAEVAARLVLLPETEHIDVVRSVVGAHELAREVLDMDSRSAVDVRRVLVGEEGYPHVLK